MSEYRQGPSISSSRRRFIHGLALVPVAMALPGCSDGEKTPAQGEAIEEAYKPRFFSAAEWAFVVAACDRLIPADEVGPGRG